MQDTIDEEEKLVLDESPFQPSERRVKRDEYIKLEARQFLAELERIEKGFVFSNECSLQKSYETSPPTTKSRSTSRKTTKTLKMKPSQLSTIKSPRDFFTNIAETLSSRSVTPHKKEKDPPTSITFSTNSTVIHVQNNEIVSVPEDEESLRSRRDTSESSMTYVKSVQSLPNIANGQEDPKIKAKRRPSLKRQGTKLAQVIFEGVDDN